MPIKAPYLPYPKLRQVASAFLSKHNPDGTIPVPIEEIVEFNFEIDIVPMPGLKDSFEIDSYITADLKEIRVDQHFYDKVPTRYRFSLAHELSHHLIHQDIFAKLTFNSVSQWKTAANAIPPEDYKWIELQAHGLAGLVLVPEAELKSAHDSACHRADEAGFDLRDVDAKMRKFAEADIARHFDVSPDVVRRRISYDKLWES